MSESKGSALKTHDEILKAINDFNAKLLEVALVDTVFGEPVELGAYTLVSAAEVFTAGGLGYGFGAGRGNLWV
jgi:uncharacterized spore protein YtfJ